MKKRLKPEFDEAVRVKESGDLLRSKQLLMELHRKDPDSAAILAVLGDVCWNLKHLDDGIDFFRKATMLKPDLDAVSLGLFHCLWAADRIDEAFDEMRRFLSQYESDAYTTLLDDLKNAKPDSP